MIPNLHGAMKDPHYLATYERYFAPIRHTAKRVLEIGVNDGSSLLMWRDYFTEAHIYGIDKKKSFFIEDRITTFQGDQMDGEALREMAAKNGPFDVVIDDASHLGAETACCFRSLIDYVVPGGLYIIEDWGTGYQKGWPDGEAFSGHRRHGSIFQSHQNGVVGFVKQLVDICASQECGWGPSPIQAMEIKPAMVIMRKQAGQQGGMWE